MLLPYKTVLLCGVFSCWLKMRDNMMCLGFRGKFQNLQGLTWKCAVAQLKTRLISGWRCKVLWMLCSQPLVFSYSLSERRISSENNCHVSDVDLIAKQFHLIQNNLIAQKSLLQEQEKRNIYISRLFLHTISVSNIRYWHFCDVSSSSNFHDDSSILRYGEHAQCRSEESAQKADAFQLGKGASR